MEGQISMSGGVDLYEWRGCISMSGGGGSL